MHTYTSFHPYIGYMHSYIHKLIQTCMHTCVYMLGLEGTLCTSSQTLFVHDYIHRHTRACFKKNSSLHILPKNFTFYVKNSDDFFSHRLFYDLLPFHNWRIAPLSCSLTPRFAGGKFLDDLFYPRIVHFISQKFWWPFFSHRPFYHFLPFRVLQVMLFPIICGHCTPLV